MTARRFLFCGFVLLLTAHGFAQASQPTQPTESGDFLDGWLQEVMDQDRIAALATYKAVANRPESPAGQRVASLVRVSELAWLNGDAATVRAAGQQLAAIKVTAPVPPPGAGTGATRPPTILELLALPPGQERQDKLAKARAALKKGVLSPRSLPRETRSLSTYRSTLPSIFERQRSAATSSQDPEILDLKRRLLEAQGRGDLSSVGKLAQRIRRRWNQMRRQWPQREEGKRRAVITQRHLDGKHDEAARWERVLLPFSSQQQAQRLLRNIERRQQPWVRRNFTAARKRLAALIQRTDVSDPERDALAALAKRLDAMANRDQQRQALMLTALVPYRQELWRR